MPRDNTGALGHAEGGVPFHFSSRLMWQSVSIGAVNVNRLKAPTDGTLPGAPPPTPEVFGLKNAKSVTSLTRPRTFLKMMPLPASSPDRRAIFRGSQGDREHIQQLLRKHLSEESESKVWCAQKFQNCLLCGACSRPAAETFVSCSWYSSLVIWYSIKI